MIEHWFPTLILCEDLRRDIGSGFNEAAYMKGKEIKERAAVKTDWYCDTFNTMGTNIKDEWLFANFSQIIGNYVAMLADAYRVKKSYKLNLVDLWVNIAAPGDYQEFHIHDRSHFSCVYYAKTPLNCGDIVFKPVEKWADMMKLETYTTDNSSSDTCRYTPREGMLLVFKSTLPHMAMKNKSNEDRCSIAANFRFDKNDLA